VGLREYHCRLYHDQGRAFVLAGWLEMEQQVNVVLHGCLTLQEYYFRSGKASMQ
jgi:hypothetical protein